MSDACRNWLACLVACAVVAGCDTKSTGNKSKTRTNPVVASSHEDAGPADVNEDDAAVATQPTGEEPAASDEDAGSKPADETTAPTEPTKPPRGDKPPKTPEPKPDAATPDEPMVMTPPVTMPPAANLPPVAGTADAAGCRSNSNPSEGMCSSFYCGVTPAQLAAEASPDRRCKDIDFACSGDLSGLTTCARRIQTAMFGASEEVVRPMIRDCVFQNEDVRAHVENECLDCFLDVLSCSANDCFLACLAGDSPQCDQCTRNAGCFDRLYTCMGYPNPL